MGCSIYSRADESQAKCWVAFDLRSVRIYKVLGLYFRLRGLVWSLAVVVCGLTGAGISVYDFLLSIYGVCVRLCCVD